MNEPNEDFEQTEPAAGGVSPLRKKISAIVLLGLLIVLGVELRAAFGQSATVKALSEIAPDGAFPPKKYTYEDVRKLLVLFPTETVERENPIEVEYRYNWTSLRPLLGKPEAAVYIVFNKIDGKLVASFHSTERTPQEELEAARRAQEEFEARGDVEQDMGPLEEGTLGGEGSQDNGQGEGNSEDSGTENDLESRFGPPRGGGFAGSGFSAGPPPVDPALAVIDSNDDGEISSEELAAASQSLLAADKNKDGRLSRDELIPGGAGSPAERRRPPLDEEC